MEIIAHPRFPLIIETLTAVCCGEPKLFPDFILFFCTSEEGNLSKTLFFLEKIQFAFYLFTCLSTYLYIAGMQCWPFQCINFFKDDQEVAMFLSKGHFQSNC